MQLLKCSRDDGGERNCTRAEPKQFEATLCSSGIIRRGLYVCVCVCADNLAGTESAGELVLTRRIKSAVTSRRPHLSASNKGREGAKVLLKLGMRSE